MGHSPRCAVTPKDGEIAGKLLCLLQSQPWLLQTTPLPGQVCYNLQWEVLGQFCLSLTWANICHVVQLVLSTEGVVPLPEMVFGTVLSQQLDEGVTQLRCVCCVDVCEHPDAAEFFLLSFLFSLGDYSDQTMALWSTHTFELLLSTHLSEPLHDVTFSPGSHQDLACVGRGAVMFWLLEQQGAAVKLKVNLPFTFQDLFSASLTYFPSPW